MAKIRNINITIIIHMLISIYIVGNIYYYYLTGYTELGLELFKYYLLFLVVWVVISSKIYLKWISTYLIFIFTMCIFLFNRVFLDIFGLYDFSFASRFGGFYFPIWTQQELLNLLLFSLVIIHFGALIAIKFKKDRTFTIELTHNKSWEKIGAFLFILTMPAFLVKTYMQLSIVFNYGYLAVYTMVKKLHYPWWTAGSGTIMLLGFSLILASKPPKKRFILYAFIFMVIQAVALLKGARGNFIISFMLLTWYYYRFYSIKDISIKKISIIAVIVIFLAQYMVIIRSGDEFDMESINDIFLLFFAQQGVSVLVPGYMIYYKDKFIREGLPYILAPVTSLGSYAPAQSVETVEKFNMLGHDLSYFLNAKYYLNGEGIAGCFIGELYDLPVVIIPILLFFLGYFIIHYHDKVGYSRFYLILSFPIVFQFFKMPRGNFFPNINVWLLLIIAFFLMRMLSKISYRKGIR